jgi:hypothetical protein
MTLRHSVRATTIIPSAFSDRVIQRSTVDKFASQFLKIKAKRRRHAGSSSNNV